MAALRRALLEAVTPEALAEIVAALVKRAKGGDVVAAREILDRTLGKSAPAELLQRIEELEQRVRNARSVASAGRN